MSNPTNQNFDESEFSDDQFETPDIPDGEESGSTEETENTVDLDESPAEAAAETTPDDGDSSEAEISDDDFETLDLPAGVSPDATKDTVELEEFPAESAAQAEPVKPTSKTDGLDETVDLPDSKPRQESQPTPTAADVKSVSDTAVNEADEDPIEDIAATVIDPQLAETDEPPHESDAQTVEINDQSEPSTAQTTYFNPDPVPDGESILENSNVMQTVNIREKVGRMYIKTQWTELLLL